MDWKDSLGPLICVSRAGPVPGATVQRNIDSTVKCELKHLLTGGVCRTNNHIANARRDASPCTRSFRRSNPRESLSF
jgi:hypothetical protein